VAVLKISIAWSTEGIDGVGVMAITDLLGPDLNQPTIILLLRRP
jgi:hypothetical protein